MDSMVNTLSNEHFVLKRVDYHGEHISPDHVNDLPKVESNQPEPALVNENEEPEEEEEFKDDEEFEEGEPQEEEYDMEVDIEEEENEPDLIFPYVKAGPLNPQPPAPNSEFEDVVEVEDMVEPEDETVPNSVHKVGESSTTNFLREDNDSLLHSFMRRGINSLFGEREVVLEDIIKDFGDAEQRAECKKLKKELEEARSSNTLLCMHKERVERDFYWTRVQAHEFYQEMISRGVVFEERPNKAIDVLIKDEDSPSSKP
ncbi:hypothetical protein Tco_1129923 [Tanacetum coccineum]